MGLMGGLTVRNAWGRRYGTRHLLVGAGILVTAIVATAGGFGMHGAAADSPDDVAIRQVIHDEQVDVHTLDTPPPGVWHAGQHIPTTVLAKWQAHIESSLAAVYTPERQAQVATAMKYHAAEQQTGEMGILDGGVDWLKFGAIRVDGLAATASVDAMTWFKFGLLGHDGQSHTSVTRGETFLSYKLVKTNAGWRISGETITFPGGATGP